ncbi:LysR family transcriptional regulator [Paremcibacter congregatus]|uniref:LysR family transcriptional regulator n=1 Tax=Paremcibacter congregatus TaxID=2043170 RepID=UPI003A8FC13E|tara:strand:+ start:647 stop:1561 length:915 start_codon:yes stop_codon:yes gene_type:complete
MIELYQLKYFLAVVETGSFTKAAERVYVTQPTLSAGIKKLESGLGTILFDRSGKRVFLTENGTRFVERAKAVLHQLNLAESAMRSEDTPKLLRLGLLMTIPSHTIQQILQPFQRQEAGLVIELFEGTEQEIQNRLDEGRIDLALSILRPGRRQDSVSLYHEPYSLALASHHPLAAARTIDPIQLANEPTIVRSRCEVLSETSRFFTSHNVRPRLVYRTAQDERALAMVAAGVGFTTMPDHYRAEGVVRRPMTGYNFTREIGLMWGDQHASPEKDALLQRFVAATQDTLPDIIYPSESLYQKAPL